MAPLVVSIPFVIGVTSTHAEALVHFAIAPQSLENTLLALAAQANISISLPNEGLGDRRSVGLNGSYSVEGALSAVLARSGYSFARAGEQAYRIVPLRQGAAANDHVDNQEIIVTAARTPTDIGRLPRSLSHVDATQLNNAGISDDSELTRLLGGLAYTNLGEGRDKILLRGVSDGALAGHAQSLVGLYFGDTRITYAAPDPDLMLVDVSAVDVLRGPQGALYGAGAMGGILRIEPHPVDLHDYGAAARASAESTQGGGVGDDYDLVLNAPLVRDRFGIRGVFYDEESAGWIDNPSLNEIDANHNQRRGARLEARAQLTPQWSITGSIVLQSIDTKDSQYLERTPAGLQRTASLLEPHDNDFSLYGATLRGDAGWAEITSNTSYLTHQLDSRFDVTGQFAALGVNPALPRPLDEGDALQIIVHETRVSSPVGAELPWFVGIFYSEGDFTRDITIRDGAFNLWPSTAYREHRVDSIDEAALFGEVTWRLSRKLTLTTGARLFQSDVSTHAATDEPLLPAAANTSGHLVDTGFAPDIRLAYQASANVLFYLSAAEGYRSRGFNTGGPIGISLGPSQPTERYAGDHIWTFEAGGRVDSADGRLRWQTVAFVNDWRDIQTDTLRANGFTYSGNVGDARAFGVEFNVHYRPTEQLSFDADLLFSEPELTTVFSSFPGAAHGSLPGSPEYSASTSVRYEDSLLLFGSGTSTWFAQLDTRYVGDAKAGFGEGPRVGGYIAVDARLGVRSPNWTATLYADNATDSDGPTFSPGNPYQPSRAFETPLRPLTIGLSLSRTF